MNKSKFRLGEQYTYQSDIEVLTYLRESQHYGTGVFKSDSGNIHHYLYCNMTPCKKPYPNPPLSHCEERIAFARGANIECQYQNQNHKTWKASKYPKWHSDFKYRVKEEKTEDEVKIERLEELIVTHLECIEIFKKELDKLKPTSHY